MHVSKAVITAAGRGQRTLPLQTLFDSDGTEKSVLSILIEEVLRAGVEEICIVVRPGDEPAYAGVAGDHAGRLHFVQQAEPLGYGHAIYCARDFAGDQPFLHLVGDHLYVSRSGQGCAHQLVQVAQREQCAVSAVQATRESLLPYFGVIGGQRLHDRGDLYRIETVIEKPTPTRAEQQLIVPGLRAGHYLCFFGMHVLTPAVLAIVTAADPQIRNRSLDAFCREAPPAALLAECAALDGFRRASDNLYERVRALFFLYAIHRFHTC
jgi:UTP--glucose-1-phosphate uridylyltransferase